MEYLISIITFMVFHLGAAIWFASRMNTQMKNLAETVKTLVLKLDLINSQDTRIAVLDSRILAVEQRVRDTRDLIVSREGRNKERRLAENKGD